MEKSSSMKIFDESTQNFLENVETPHIPHEIDLEILKRASEFNVDLSGLESDNVGKNIAITAQVEKEELQIEDSSLKNDFLSEIDVSLSDIINKVIQNSSRPFVIIRDDKIEYVNQTFLKLMDLSSEIGVVKEKFLKFVVKEDWNLLAENVGEMLTNNKNLFIRLQTDDGKIIKTNFDAIYLPDNQHFSFILAGENIAEKKVAVSGLYDDLTGLPNFYLFEDRVQMAVNNENYKDARLNKNVLAVVGIAIDNLVAFKKIGMHKLVLKKLSERLALSLKKTYSVSAGLKYQFWVLITDVTSKENLDIELQKIRALFAEPVADNFTQHEILTSIGVSIFPEPATSAKKLIEQSIMSIKKAQKEGGDKMVLFGS